MQAHILAITVLYFISSAKYVQGFCLTYASLCGYCQQLFIAGSVK